MRADLRTCGLNDTADDPGEMLLRLVTLSWMRCELYADLLQRAFDAAERARERGDDPEDVNSDERRELDEVLQRGGVATLVGKVYSGVRTARRRIANPCGGPGKLAAAQQRQAASDSAVKTPRP